MQMLHAHSLKKKAFQLNANRPFADSMGYIVNSERISTMGGGGCTVRSKQNISWRSLYGEVKVEEV